MMSRNKPPETAPINPSTAAPTSGASFESAN